MSGEFLPGDPILYMKVGVHASESLADIVERKRREIAEAGFAMWGYGGNTCHPTTKVQPFVADYVGLRRPIRLVMEPIKSNHFATGEAQGFSLDGDPSHVQPVPDGIKVLGSRFALCIQNLEIVETELELDLGRTKVAVGQRAGTAGSQYIRGRVDKACLEVVEPLGNSVRKKIGLIADLTDPYAVFMH